MIRLLVSVFLVVALSLSLSVSSVVGGLIDIDLSCPAFAPSVCGDLCYSQSEHTCINGELQPIGATTAPAPAATQPPPPATQPPPPAAATQAPAPTAASASGCGLPGDQKCGNRCYNPSTHVCTNAATEFLCPVAYPNQCGAGCYSSTQYTCDNGQLKPVSPAPAVTQPPATSAPTAAPGCVIPGDLRCGNRCYSPITHVCADAGSNFLCPTAYPSKCGDACYSTSQYQCENDQLKGL